MKLTPQNTVTWYDRTTAEHKSLVDKWAADGFRTLSLSIYGDPSDLRYAAVMVKRPSVHAESQVSSRTEAQLQQDFHDNANKGRGPYIITATGPANAPVFAACFRPMNTIPFTRLNLSYDAFVSHNAERHALGEILLWVDVFGAGLDARFMGIWGPNPGKQAWSIDGYDVGKGVQEFVEDPVMLRQRFDAVKSTWGRPAHIALTPASGAVALFVDSTIGPWVLRSGMTGDAFQTEYDKQTHDGLQPIQLSAKGSGSNARFAAIFSSREDTDPRTFRSQGPVAVAAIDDVIKDFMQAENLRGAALAITRGTQLVYAKGYTLAEADYPDITPQTLFRQASVSKTFTGVAMMRLLQLKPDITLDTTVQSVMNLKQPDGSAPADPRWAKITIRHLIESDSGLWQGLFYSSAAASKAFGTPLPTTSAQLLSYATSQMLTGEPGDKNNAVYGNFDYLLLSNVVARLAGTTTFEQALTQLVLQPLHQTHTRGSRSRTQDQLPGEARHHMTVYRPKGGWQLYPFEVLRTEREPDGKLAPTHYGNLDYEIFAGAGGLSASIVDMARLGAMFSDRTGNPVLSATTIDNMLTACANAGATLKTSAGKGSHGYYGLDWVSVHDAADHVYTGEKGGWLPAHQTVLHFTTGGFGYALAINGNKEVKDDWLAPVGAIAGANPGTPRIFFSSTFDMPSLAPAMISAAISLDTLSAAKTQLQVMTSISQGRAAAH